MKLFKVTLAALCILVSPTQAHVPSECGELFIATGKATEITVRIGQRVSEASLAGLGSSDPYKYEYLVDLVSQLLGAQAAQYDAITKAIECVHPQ